MKRYIYLSIVLFASTLIEAQIGINTDLPQNLFHIDAQKNTSGVANIADDVVIDNNGNMGLGVLSPTAKLHIVSRGATPAIRIVDGTEANTRMLRSDANGNVSWVNQPQSGGEIQYLTGSLKNYPNGSSSLLTAKQITESGNYLVIIRWWGTTTSSSDTNTETSAYFFLDDGANNSTARGTVKDGIEYYVRTMANEPFCFTTSLFATMQAGRWIKIFIAPSIGARIGMTSFNWQIGRISTTNTNYNPSVVFFKI